MKKSILIFAIVLILFILLVCLLNPFLFEKNGNGVEVENKNLPEAVTIKQYKPGSDELVKELKIYSKEKIEDLSRYVYKLKPLEEHEMVNLALLQEIDIVYNDSISIGVQLEVNGYCYYTNLDENISSLSKMPNGLVDWVKDNLDIK